MLADAHWMRLEPLIEACRPKGKTPPQDLRRTITAILWRHENGAKWRAIPADLGPWSRAGPCCNGYSQKAAFQHLRRFRQFRKHEHNQWLVISIHHLSYPYTNVEAHASMEALTLRTAA